MNINDRKIKKEGTKKMQTINWDEKYFEESGLYIWIYNRGYLECTNNKYRHTLKLSSLRIYNSKNSDNIFIKKTTDTKKDES